MPVEGIAFLVLDDRTLNATQGDIGLERLELLWGQVGQDLIFGSAVRSLCGGDHGGRYRWRSFEVMMGELYQSGTGPDLLR